MVIRYESKSIVIDKKEMQKTGIKLAGGNKSGIFVKHVIPGSPAHRKGVTVGWRIRAVSVQFQESV